PPGVIATEAGVHSIDLLETVGEPRGRQLIRSKPPAEIGKRSCDRRKSDADQGESCQHAGLAEARPLGFCWCFEVDRHIHSNLGLVTRSEGIASVRLSRPPGQTAYALNLISPFVKSTVPGAQPGIEFTQEYSAAEVKSVTLSRSGATGDPGSRMTTPSAKIAIFLPSSVVISAWTWSSIRPSART